MFWINLTMVHISANWLHQSKKVSWWTWRTSVDFILAFISSISDDCISLAKNMCLFSFLCLHFLCIWHLKINVAIITTSTIQFKCIIDFKISETRKKVLRVLSLPSRIFYLRLILMWFCVVTNIFYKGAYMFGFSRALTKELTHRKNYLLTS